MALNIHLQKIFIYCTGSDFHITEYKCDKYFLDLYMTLNITYEILLTLMAKLHDQITWLLRDLCEELDKVHSIYRWN